MTIGSLKYLELGELQNPKSVIFVLHGYTNNSAFMKPTAAFFARKMPQAAIIIPEGPLALSPEQVRPADRRIMEPSQPIDPKTARSWFDMHPVKMPLRIIFNRIDSQHRLNKLIDQQLERFNLQPEQCGLFGFSQGGALALYSAFARKTECGGVVCHSGAYPGLRRPRSRPETLYIVGNKDRIYEEHKQKPTVRFSFARSVKQLENINIPLTTTVIPGIGHRMSQKSLDEAAHFLKMKLG